MPIDDGFYKLCHLQQDSHVTGNHAHYIRVPQQLIMKKNRNIFFFLLILCFQNLRRKKQEENLADFIHVIVQELTILIILGTFSENIFGCQSMAISVEVMRLKKSGPEFTLTHSMGYTFRMLLFH